MKYFPYIFTAFIVLVGLSKSTCLNAQVAAPSPVKKHTIKPFRIRLGIGFNGFLGRKTDLVQDELRDQGFANSKHSFHSDPLLGSATSSQDYPTSFKDYSPVFLWVDGVLFKNLLIGLQRRHFTVHMDGFHFFYKEKGAFNDFDDVGHLITFQTKTALLEPKIGWIDRTQHIALYGGPAFIRHRFETGTKRKLGYWGGIEAMVRGKRRGFLFFRFFTEYHYLPKITWAEESFSTEYEGQTYTSQFKGSQIDLSFFTLGLGTGLSF